MQPSRPSELVREPHWLLQAQRDLGEEPTRPVQERYATKRRLE